MKKVESEIVPLGDKYNIVPEYEWEVARDRVIYWLSLQGFGVIKISKMFKLDKSTVSRIISQLEK